MEQKTYFYKMKEKGEISEFSIFYSGDMIIHKETVKFHLVGRKFVFTGTCLRACSTAVAIMGKHYQKVIKSIEEEKEYCDEVNAYWIMSDEEIEQLGDFIKNIRDKKYVTIFDYQNRSNT